MILNSKHYCCAKQKLQQFYRLIHLVESCAILLTYIFILYLLKKNVIHFVMVLEYFFCDDLAKLHKVLWCDDNWYQAMFDVSQTRQNHHQYSIPSMKPGADNIVLWGFFSTAHPGGTMTERSNDPRGQPVVWELPLRTQFMCQHYNTQNKTKVTQGRHESNSVNVLECLSQCSDLSPNPEFMAGLENFCSRFNRAFSFILNPRNSSLTKKEINKM